MRNKSCGNGSKNCVAFRNVMRNGIAIGNPTKKRPSELLRLLMGSRVWKVRITENLNTMICNNFIKGLE